MSNTLTVEKRFNRNGTPKRDAINILTKKNIIDDVENGMKYVKIKEKYGLKCISNVCRIVKEKSKWLAEFEKDSSPFRLTTKTTKYANIDQGIRNFVSNCNQTGTRIGIESIRDKALEMVQASGQTELKLSNGYIWRALKRTQITTKKQQEINEPTRELNPEATSEIETKPVGLTLEQIASSQTQLAKVNRFFKKPIQRKRRHRRQLSTGNKFTKRTTTAQDSESKLDLILETLRQIQNDIQLLKAGNISSAPYIDVPLSFNNKNLLEIEAPTLTIFGNRVAEFLWTPETLLKFRIADEGQPSRDSQSERVAFTHPEDLRKIDLLKRAIKIKYKVSDQDWNETWQLAKKSINAIGRNLKSKTKKKILDGLMQTN